MTCPSIGGTPIDRLTGVLTRAFGIASAPLAKNRFRDINPSPVKGAFGLFDDNDKFPASVFTVVSMTDGKVIQPLRAYLPITCMARWPDA